MKRKKLISTTKKLSSAISTEKKGKWKKRPKPIKRKGRELSQAFAATKPAWVAPERTMEWLKDDFIPMRHMPSGRPLGSHCTCTIAPNKYCWKCKKWAARPDIAPFDGGHEEVNREAEDGPPDLWSDGDPQNYGDS